MNILWFQRDLRLTDHAPLTKAIEAGKPLLLVYCFEPSLLNDSHFDIRHGRFIMESIQAMRQLLRPYHIVLHVFRNDFVSVLEKLHQRYGVDTVFSHRETSFLYTHEHNEKIAAFCTKHQIDWDTSPKLPMPEDTEDWNKEWLRTMKQSIPEADLSKIKSLSLGAGFLEAVSETDYPYHFYLPNYHFQKGGQSEAHAWLESFLSTRAVQYPQATESPYLSRYNCSRLSPYIAWGNITTRQVYQTQLAAAKKGLHPEALRKFVSRLRLHDQLVYKTPPPFLSLKGVTEGQSRLFEALKVGNTGIPIIDAGVRCLKETGYLIPRLRFLIGWLIWHRLAGFREKGIYWLASQFLDFEPEVFYCYINQIQEKQRLNLINESLELDPSGHFIKLWVQEIQQLPPRFMHQPWLMRPYEQNNYGVWVGDSYPHPPKEWVSGVRHKKRKRAKTLVS